MGFFVFWILLWTLGSPKGLEAAQPLAQLFARVAPSVVDLYTLKKGPHGLAPGSFGAGVVVEASGLVLTHAHVIQGAAHIRVVLQTGQEYEAKVVGRNAFLDLTLLHVPVPKGSLQPVVWCEDVLEPGETLLAFGNPGGLGHTITQGILVHPCRTGVSPDGLRGFVQINGLMGPGYSGGGVFNAQGKLVGLSTAIWGKYQALGVGFATPVRSLRFFLDHVKKGVSQVIGDGGLRVRDLTNTEIKVHQLRFPYGVWVQHVSDPGPDTPCVGDILEKIEGRPMESASFVAFILATTPPGTFVNLDVRRGGQRQRVKLRVHARGD